ncbi:MAG: signal transduction histidine kinase/CheY-like chemotaxis protein [Crocinitomicaceae bacterium]|jgi:signal transduction histidine kinase/CheY-like chemotaxis protein/ligand-binding sensor domain-containing protein
MRKKELSKLACLQAMMCRRTGLLLFSICFIQLSCFNSLQAQQGRPYISNFPPISYSSNSYVSSPQNWCIGHTINDQLIVANTSGILLYDGTVWQMISGTEDKMFYKFVADANGEIFTGGDGEIGVLKANKDGRLVFHSLLNKLDQEDRDFGRITKVVSHNGDVYFRSKGQLIRYSKGVFKTWKSESGFTKLVSSSSGVFIAEKSSWFQIQNDSLHVIASADEEKLPSWIAVFPGPKGGLLIATKYDGFFHLHDNKLSQLSTELNPLTLKNGCQISDHKFALATDEHGVIIVNRNGEIVDLINKSMGLSSNSALFPFYEDGNLWLAMNSGISLIEYPIRTSILNEENGLNSFPFCTVKYQDNLFVGTPENAYWVGKDDHTNLGIIKELEEPIRSIFDAKIINGKLLVSNSKGIYITNEDGSNYYIKAHSNTECNVVIQSTKFKNLIYTGNNNFILPIQLGDKSSEALSDRIKLPHWTFSMAEDDGGNLWAAHDGISLINFSKGYDNPTVTTLDSSNGLSEEMGIIEVVSVNDQVLFGTEIGVYSYNRQSKKLVPNPIFGKKFCDGSTSAYNLTEMRNGDVWITTTTHTGILRKQKNDSYIYDSLPLMRAPISDVWDIYEDDDNIVWICGTEAIVRYDPAVSVNHHASYNAFIRSVIINDKNEIFAGNYADKNGFPTTKQPASYIPTLNYDQNSITIKFGAADFAKDYELEYSVILVGKDTEWSTWRTTNEMSYNNLGEGKYTFKVRSKNVYGNISQDAVYSFEILPPWHRTIWAYFIFVVGGMLFLYLIVKLNSRRLVRENAKLENVITERTAEVTEQKERAEQSEAFKQQFLANMSHEIRTPMNAVMGMTNLVLGTPLKPKQKDYMEGIKKSSDILLHIINDILDLSKIEAGKMELEEIDFSLSDFIEQIRKTLQHRASDKGLELMTSIKPDVSDIILGDPVRLNQILINLTGNAIKFTEKGSVAIEVTKVDNGVRFAIVDTGIGIPKDKLETVFESFSQANASDTRKFGGTGLGLSISRQLVELMGGGITIESEEGFGTTFSFVVDFKLGSKEQLDKRIAMEGSVDGSILNGLRILVTDDNEFNRIVARDTLLSVANVEIFEAENGRDAIKILQEREIDVILMDVQMPIMNGYEATRTIRALNSSKRETPIVALTASVVRTDLDKCKKAGMNSYVPKPFRTHDLITGIAEVLKIELRASKVSNEDSIGKETMSEKVSDLGYLTNFCDGDKVKMKKYIDMFIKGASQLETQIALAVENDDGEALANQVHSFNTKFIMMGMKDSKSLSIAIENKLRDDGTISEVIDNVELLKSDIKSAVDELSQFEAN